MASATTELIPLGESGNSILTTPSILPSFVLLSDGCSQMKRITEGLQLFVNIIGGVCLGISNYLQQLCTSPTSEDIRSEMRQHGDIDFGANLPSALFRRIKKRKLIVALWLLLLFTSLPMHLFLNASIGLAPTSLSVSVAAIYPSMTSEYVIGEQSPQNLTADDCQSFVLAANSETFNLNVSSVTAVIDPVNVANCNAIAYNLTLPSVPT